MEKHIQLPLTEELAKTLHAGDTVYLSGTIYTSVMPDIRECVKRSQEEKKSRLIRQTLRFTT